MAITVNIVGKEFIGGNSGSVAIVVEYSNGNTTITHRYQTGLSEGTAWLADQIVIEKDRLEAIETYYGTIPTGPYTPGSQSAASLAREEYDRKLKLLRHSEGAITLGIIEDTNVDYVALKAWLVLNFETSYVDLF